ncbi:MAG: 8-oxo-dGTP diphosphatase [Lachnospiraceae bacterium]|nr:8-oxo-dGTP diphosphatase [Lachnospiraceae bacterium]
MNEKNGPILTTLCYIEQDDKYLMLHRIKKQNDLNKDKYIGVGGHVEFGETPDECLKREVYEETGAKNISYKARGLVIFIYGNEDEPEERIVEYMHLYTARLSAEGFGLADPFRVPECDEGELVWIEKDAVCDLPIWEGDKIFFRLLKERTDYFSLKLVYNKEDKLIEAALNGEALKV